jgi:hypothetical protein
LPDAHIRPASKFGSSKVWKQQHSDFFDEALLDVAGSLAIGLESRSSASSVGLSADWRIY